MNDKYQGVVLKHEMNTKIAGSSFRQDVIKTLTVGDQLVIEREPSNEHDANAVKIMTVDGLQVGYLNKDLAAHIAPALDAGFITYTGEVTQVTGGTGDKPTLGVNILLKSSRSRDLVKSPLDNEYVQFNPTTHRYFDANNVPMISGSAFQERYEKPFPDFGEAIKAKGEQARDFGTAIHEAIALYGQHNMEASSRLVRPIINALFTHPDWDGDTKKLYECFIHWHNLCGVVDCLEFVDDTHVNIHDWKTVDDLNKNVGKCLAPFENLKTKADHYQLQQGFYAYILKKLGYTVEHIYLWDFGDEELTWRRNEIQILDLGEAIADTTFEYLTRLAGRLITGGKNGQNNSNL